MSAPASLIVSDRSDAVPFAARVTFTLYTHTVPFSARHRTKITFVPVTDVNSATLPDAMVIGLTISVVAARLVITVLLFSSTTYTCSCVTFWLTATDDIA